MYSEKKFFFEKQGKKTTHLKKRYIIASRYSEQPSYISKNDPKV
ncbi:hypothetical protein M23134_01447 [Microscilla marina ATCC 23134]|uniref:Uncharacterized protein n=1 Tax=Microscilla marina ATCC 23134 TaxID=313606 RepID=A1ZJT8_MICM2|nr:hypothetical protein M23134_01447 [Microscilla marina ATCC 23134]